MTNIQGGFLMEKEISSGTMLGIVLIALAAVIGLGFGVFSIAKGVANEGTVGVQDNLGTVSESSFDDYNDKVVTGTMVKSAVQNFTGKSVAILINTNAMTKGVVTNKAHETAYVFKVGERDYINYNALLAGDSIGEEKGNPINAVQAVKGEGSTKLINEKGDIANIKDGILIVANPFAINQTTGKVEFDNSVGGFSRSGNCEYLSPAAKFEANLIRDTSGTTIGIIFTQMTK